VPRRWGWVDPMKDVQAKILAIDNLLESRRSTIAETGDDIEDIFEELKEDAALQAEYGLEIVRPNQPQAAAEPDGDEEDPAEEADEPDEMPPGKLTSPGL
jgi:capsid protein